MMLRSAGSYPGGATLPWYRAGGAPMPVAAYQPIGAASLAASYVNLANPGTNDAAPGVAPTWNIVNGWMFGSGGSLLTGITPSVNYAMIARFSSASGSISGVMQNGNTAGARFWLYPIFSAGHTYASGGLVTVGANLAAGIMGIADNQGYLNGVADATVTGWTTTSGEVRIHDTNGVVYIQAAAIWSMSTNHAIWMPAVSAAMAVL